MTVAGGGSVFVLDPGADLLAAAPIYGGLSTPEDRLRALARAIAASPGFRAMDGVVLVVRTTAPLRLGLVGRVSESERTRVEALPGIIQSGLRRLRYVSYPEAESVTRRLAERLEKELGKAELSRCRFAGLPRGGLVVLGMLSYALGLRAEQVEVLSAGKPQRVDGAPDGSTLVIVDDCALTGLRFVEALQRVGDSSVVFAHLFSHPDLREVLETEPRVRACVAGDDLTDTADRILGEDREAWRERWSARSGGRARWIGLPEHVCFPWNEPDITVWNRTSEAEEAPWRVVPPEYCLKNRPLAAGERLQEQGAARGPLQPGDSTLIARQGGDIMVADWAAGVAYVFEGMAADVWAALLSEGGVEAAVDRLRGAYEVEVERLRADVRSLLDQALELGLLKLEEHDGPHA